MASAERRLFEQRCTESLTPIIVPDGTITVPSETVARLEDWAGWARSGGGNAHGRCASAEGNYKSGSGDGGFVLIGDLRLVLLVERVVCTRLPRTSREIIKHHFVLRRPPKVVAMALGINRFHYGKELQRSILMVKNNLTAM